MGFAIAQGRLGPGRIHHCMRLIGHAERCLELTKTRLSNRIAFGKPIAAQGVWQERIGLSRIEIEQVILHFYVIFGRNLTKNLGPINDTSCCAQDGYCWKQSSC